MTTLSNNLYQEEITENVGILFALAVKLDISILILLIFLPRLALHFS